MGSFEMEECWINKVDVARRQISEAVRLFFAEHDPLVIHTFAAAAHQVLFDIGTAKGVESTVKNTAALRGEELQRHLRAINYLTVFSKTRTETQAKRLASNHYCNSPATSSWIR